MSAQPVDVLARLEAMQIAARERYGQGGAWLPQLSAQEDEVAIAAVAELIEAAREADARTGCDCPDTTDRHRVTCWKFDFCAALARIGGAA